MYLGSDSSCWRCTFCYVLCSCLSIFSSLFQLYLRLGFFFILMCLFVGLGAPVSAEWWLLFLSFTTKPPKLILRMTSTHAFIFFLMKILCLPSARENCFYSMCSLLQPLSLSPSVVPPLFLKVVITFPAFKAHICCNGTQKMQRWNKDVKLGEKKMRRQRE